MSRLFDGEPGKEPEFDQPRLPFVHGGQRVQSIIESNQIQLTLCRNRQVLVEDESDRIAATFLRALHARVVHEDAAHKLSSHGEEMNPVFPTDGVAGKPQIRFMNQCRALQRIARLRCQAPFGNAAKLAINQGNELFSSRKIAFAPAEEQLCHRAGSGGHKTFRCRVRVTPRYPDRGRKSIRYLRTAGHPIRSRGKPDA